MIRPDYKDFKRPKFGVINNPYLMHSAEGSSWKKHKYIKRIDGTYYYPDSYKGGRHLPDGEKNQASDSKDKLERWDNEKTARNLNENDVENLAKEVIRGNFGNGQQRKDLLGENYTEVQKRVNELMKSSVGSKKVLEATPTSISVAEEAAKRAIAIVEKHRNKK